MLKKFGFLAFGAFFVLSSVSMARASEKTKQAEQVPIILIGHGTFKKHTTTENDSLILQAKNTEGYYVNNKTCHLCDIQTLPKTLLKTPVVRQAIDERLKETIDAMQQGKETKRIKPTYVTVRYGKNETDYVGSFKMILADYLSNQKENILYFNPNTITSQKGEKPQFGKEYFFSVCVDNISTSIFQLN